VCPHHHRKNQQHGTCHLSGPEEALTDISSLVYLVDVQHADIPNGTSFAGTPRYYRHSLQGKGTQSPPD
jgi:hypothetical protein